MLKTISAALLATSLIAGPVLAQGTANTNGQAGATSTTAKPAAKAADKAKKTGKHAMKHVKKHTRQPAKTKTKNAG